MLYKVSGSLSKAMDLTVLDSYGNLEKKQSFPAGAYEISGLTISSGIVFGNTADDQFKGFGHVNFIEDGTSYQAPAGAVSITGVLRYGVRAVAWYSDSTGFVVGYNHDVINDTCMALFKRTDNTFNLSKHITTVNNDGDIYEMTFDLQGNYLYPVGNGSYWTDYFKRNGDDYTALTAPSTILPGTGVSISAWNEYIAIGHEIPPWITIYKRSGDTLSKLTDLYNFQSQVTHASSWSPGGVYVALGINLGGSSVPLQWFKRDGDTFTRLNNPSTMPAGTVAALKWDASGTYLACNSASSTRLLIYKRNGDTLTKLTDPSTLPGSVSSVSWSHDSKYLAVGIGVSPYIWIYERSGDTFTKMNDLASPPTSACNELAFSPNSSYLAAGLNLNPYLKVYKCAEELGLSA